MSEAEISFLPAEEIWRVGHGSGQPLISAVSSHLLATRGKQLRSSLLLEAAALGSGADQVLVRRAAAVLEAIHLASLAHDDVIDDSGMRRGAVTAGARFGCVPAAFGGGWLFARCVEAAAVCGDTVIELLTAAVAEMCDGEMLELEDIGNVNRTPDRYLRAVEGKTAALFALAARVGGELAGLPRLAREALATFGTQLGIAFQIADDVLDLAASDQVTGKPGGNDVRHGVYTLPVLYALQERPWLRDRLTRRIQPEDLAGIVALIMQTRGPGRALEECRRYADAARCTAGSLTGGCGGHGTRRLRCPGRPCDRARVGPVMKTRSGLPLIDEAEVVVIGAGPAGSAAALTLAAHGHDVLIVDKAAFPRDKPCGDGLPRFAVSCLERFGLGQVLRDSPLIEGGRLVFNQTSEELKSYRHGHGRCVTRVQLDSALLNRALEAGARLITARVTGPVMDDDRVAGVGSDQRGGRGWIRGSYFVAADGPTSIMSHRLGLARQRADISGYAVRQYFDVEHSLDPLFDIYVPIKCGDRGLVGYGWVFPVGERRANIGVGFYRSRGDTTPPIRTVLTEFVAELRARQAKRFGQIVPLGKQFGSPIGMNFSPHACQWGNVVFAGDSAGMTDPLTGEGISSALAGGEEAGNYLHGVLHRPAARASSDASPFDASPALGARLARISVRLGQNIGMPARVADQALREHPDRVGSILAGRFGTADAGQPLLHLIYQMWAGDDIERTLDEASAMPGISGVKGLPEALAELGEQAQDYLRPTFPFAAEIIQRRLRERHGRMLGAALFTSILACGGVISEEDITIALAYELVNMFPDILAQVADKPEGTRGKLNNAIAVIVADYVLTRCLKLVSALGTRRVVQLARAVCAVCEDGMSEVMAARGPEQFRAEAGTRSATLYALLCRIGAERAGSSPAITAALETYGHHLGMAFRIAAEVRESAKRDPAAHLGAPDSPSLASVIGLPAGFDAGEAAGQCRAHVEKARNSVAGLVGITPEPLFALAEIAARQCAEFADAVGKNA